LRRSAAGDDPLEVPPYVAESLRAWCALHAARARAPREYSTEYEVMHNDPTYDPEWDWLDEPFPEERDQCRS
jgi:hypothetical protein